jgi:preprotein translocase subunit YajC
VFRQIRTDRKAGIVPLAAQSQGGSAYGMWILLLLFMLAAYFLIIRPQQRRRREVQAVQSSLGPGDEVVTIAGLYGTVVDVDDKTVTLEVAPGINNKYARQAIAQVVNSASKSDPAESTTTSSDVVDPD